MIIKKYVANNINEAMTRIKFELGNDAVIVSQRKIKKPGFFGLFSGKLIEVTAAVENAEDEQIREVPVKEEVFKEKSSDDEFKESIESIKRIMEKEQLMSEKVDVRDDISSSSAIGQKIKEHNKKVNEQVDVEESNLINDVKNEVSELKGLINKVLENTSSSTNGFNISAKDENKELIEKLDDMDVDECFYEEICTEVNENKDVDTTEMLREIFERDILISTKDLNGKIVLVGPTGVGKTTTIAKLAGRLALVEKKNIGLITVDTYRIGAIEQLKTYAEIMNIPFSVVITTKEMEQAIESMNECDVILIDTTGRSSKNAMQISELRAFIEKANPNIVNMVVSATTKNKDIKTILEGYKELNYNNIIITKLDETISYGCLYNIARISNKPVSFITTGQNVPDDISVPTKEDMSIFILREETLC